MRKTEWKIKEIPNINQKLLDKIPVDNDILKILYSRGFQTEEQIKKFLNPKLENMQNPYDLYDMEKAVLEIEKAINEQKNIWIYGDYDVDGITSTSILYLALKELGAENVNYYIPLRDEGYGLNNDALKIIKEAGAELLITVDCGITALEEVEFATSIDLPVIVTDHHNLNGNKIPNAVAVINPKRKENKYNFQNLAGVGTIFMVILCLYENKFKERDKAYNFLDLVSIGTIADIVPLVEENRILAKFGLEQLPFSKHKGLRFLIYKLFGNQENPKTEYSSYDVGFIIAPVFNAAGRLKDAKMVVKLLISDNNREIETIVEELINKNYERKDLQNEVIENIEKNIEEKKLNEDFVIIDAAPEYHHGIIGIAASKIVDKYYKPTIVMELKQDEGVAVGSCRSIHNFNILAALQSMPELFTKFGGHSGAAGFTIPIKNLELFKKKMNDFAKKQLSEDDFVKIIDIDKVIPIQKISYEFFKTIELMKPFGFGNPMPTLQTKSVFLQNMRLIGENKNHIMFDLEQKGFRARNATWFNSGELFTELSKNAVFDVVYKLKLEYFQDRYYVKIYVDDIKISKLKENKLNFYYSLYNTIFPLKSIFYTNLDVEENINLTTQNEAGELLLYQGRKFAGRLDSSISNLLILLEKYYGWKFKIKVENIVKTTSHNIIEIIIRRDYSFSCFEFNDIAIFKKIKEFLIQNMEYDSFTKQLLGEFYKNKKNLIIENNKQNINLFLLTLGIYYFHTTKKKSQIIVKNIENNFSSFIKKYFEIKQIENYDKNIEFTVFCEIDETIENDKRFCIISKNEETTASILKTTNIQKENIEIIKNITKIQKNIIFLNSLKKEERKNLKNIYVKYLPFEEKIKLKQKLNEGQTIYCDDSIFEIL